MGFFASVDGRIVPAEQATVSVLDTGFTFGDAVYETLRTYGGRPFAVDRHLLRLRRSAARLSIALPITDADLRARQQALLEQAANRESYVRWIVSRGKGDVSYHFDRIQGPTIVMLVKPYEEVPEALYREGVAVSLVSVRRNSPQALDPAIKSCNLLNNVLAVQEAQARGGYEPILLNEHGEVAEGATCNVFLVRRGQLMTPPLDAGILAGITREVVLELARALALPVTETRLRTPDLLDADELFITSSLKELLPVRAVDRRSVGGGRPGQMTQQLLAAFREYAKGHCG